MNKLLTIVCLLFAFTPYSLATAFGAATAWDVRTTGADTNAGAFDSGVASPGTDASQGAGIAFSDLVATGTTASSATVAFSSTTHGPGNFLIIASGTGCTPGTYEMLTQAAGVGTFNVSMGTGTCTGVFGGSKLTVDAAGALEVSGNTIWVKTGTYSRSTTLSLSGVAIQYLRGYGTTQGDLGTAPLITTATDSTPLVFFNASTIQTIQNISFSNTASVRSTGIEDRSGFRLVIDRCTFDGFTKTIDGDNSGSTSIFTWLMVSNTEIKNATVFAIVNGAEMYLYNNYIHDNTNSGSYRGSVSQATNGKATVLVGNLIVKNGGSNPNGDGVALGTGPNTVDQNTIADNNNHNIELVNGDESFIQDNVLYGSSIGYGIYYNSVTAPQSSSVWNNNAFGANFLGAVQSPLTTGTNPVTLTADPFTNDSGSNRDYSLNATAGGGAALKAAGFPGVFPGGTTTGYLDIGAVQSQGASGATSGPYGSVN